MLIDIRAFFVRIITSLSFLRKPSIKYCIDNKLLPGIFTKASSSQLREILNLPASDHSSQLNQDLFALIMNQFRKGFFLEIGAYDGYILSNTVYLEEEFGWKGILVEANPRYIESLSRRKNSIIVNKAVSHNKGKEEFLDANLYGGLKNNMDKTHANRTDNAETISVDCVSLQEILDRTGAPNVINFISIDVEGGELPIVEQMVLVKNRFTCGCIEYNNRQDDYVKIKNMLETAGYRVVWENQTGQDMFFVNGK